MNLGIGFCTGWTSDLKMVANTVRARLGGGEDVRASNTWLRLRAAGVEVTFHFPDRLLGWPWRWSTRLHPGGPVLAEGRGETIEECLDGVVTATPAALRAAATRFEAATRPDRQSSMSQIAIETGGASLLTQEEAELVSGPVLADVLADIRRAVYTRGWADVCAAMEDPYDPPVLCGREVIRQHPIQVEIVRRAAT